MGCGNGCGKPETRARAPPQIFRLISRGVSGVSARRALEAGYEGREEAIAGVVQAKVEQLRGWQRPSDAELRERGLSSRQIGVTRKDGTEPAFRNEYWDNHKAVCCSVAAQRET